MTHRRAEGEAVCGVSLDLINAFDSVSNSTVLKKTSAQGLGSCTFFWIKDCWDRAQTVVVNGAPSW